MGAGVDRLLVRAEVAMVGVERGTETWVEETDRVKGLIAGGYWSVLQRQEAPGSASRRRSAATPEPPAEVPVVEAETKDAAGKA